MTNNSNSKKISYIINFVYIITIIFTAYMVFRYALSLVMPFLIALFISFIAEPAVQVITKKLKFKRSIASALSITILLVIVFLIVTLLSATVCSRLKEIYDNIPTYKDELISYFESLVNKDNSDTISGFEKLILDIFKYIKGIDIQALFSGSLGRHAINSFSNIMMSIPYIFMTIVITFVSSFFISSSFTEIKEFILMQFSQKNRELIFEAKKSIFSVLKKYLKSYVTLMLITFCELTILFLIFKIPSAASLALIISAVDILPVLGVGTIMIPWAIICLITGDITMALILTCIYIFVTVTRQIIEPKIVGESIGMHPVVTLISIYVGLKLFGILGMFVIPIIIIIISDLQKKGTVKLWKEKKN